MLPFRKKTNLRASKYNSDSVNLTCGIPQGSNLGISLFLLSIDDLSNCFEKTQFSMFAQILTYLVKANRPARLKTCLILT